MRAVSPKRAKQLAEYRKLRIPYLDARPWCESPWGCGNRASEVHHKRGRIGALLLDTAHWAALCPACHHRATVNPAEAIAAGVSESRLGRTA